MPAFLGGRVLNHVFDREHLVVAEGWSLAHAPTAAKLAAVDAWGSRAVRITVLRHPIARAVSRYWFEGRWQLFAKGHDEEAAMPLHTWLAGDHCMPGAAAKGGRLWNCFSNYYVKSFAGWRGEAMCDPSADGCVGGVGPAQLEVAKQVLKSRFDAVLISEWLSSRPQVRSLAFEAGSFCSFWRTHAAACGRCCCWAACCALPSTPAVHCHACPEASKAARRARCRPSGLSGRRGGTPTRGLLTGRPLRRSWPACARPTRSISTCSPSPPMPRAAGSRRTCKRTPTKPRTFLPSSTKAAGLGYLPSPSSGWAARSAETLMCAR